MTATGASRSANAARRCAGVPEYLSAAYWWAYIAPAGVWLFDRQPIINAILFGQYRRLMRASIALMAHTPPGRTLQLAAVYGALTPALGKHLPAGALHLVDVVPIQLEQMRRKLRTAGRPAHLVRMNTERLAYAKGSFDTVLLYFLLHELPPAARRRTLAEALRVLRPGGTLVIADYAELARTHPFHCFGPMRCLLERCEPYLGDFWRQNLDRLIAAAAFPVRKTATLEARRQAFRGFYRVCRYRIDAARG